MITLAVSKRLTKRKLRKFSRAELTEYFITRLLCNYHNKYSRTRSKQGRLSQDLLSSC